MKQLSFWSLMYVVPISALFLGVAGILFSVKIETRWSTVVAVGSSLTAISLLVQRFSPIASATFDSSNNLVASSGPTFIRYLAGVITPIGIIIIAADPGRWL